MCLERSQYFNLNKTKMGFTKKYTLKKAPGGFHRTVESVGGWIRHS